MRHKNADLQICVPRQDLLVYIRVVLTGRLNIKVEFLTFGTTEILDQIIM